MSSFRDYVDWLWQAKGAPYVWWLGGEVSRYDGPPAWAVNEPLPSIEDVKNGGFCVAVYNLACRYFGLTIPNVYGEEFDGGVVSTYEYWYGSSKWYSDRRNEGFQDGDLLISPYQGVSSQGHVAMICYSGGTPYVIEWISSGGLVWNYTPDQSNSWGDYELVVPASVWSQGKVDGGGSAPAPAARGPYEYPGDCADPAPVARWMARVAHDKYGLPPELPVMTSYVELTSAWTGPGCVYDIPGYSYAVDHASLGYFQQQTPWWGTAEQIQDANYALAKFCEAAVEMAPSENSVDGPAALGEWCANVQRPYEAYRYRYAEWGYPAARELIAGWDTEFTDDEPKPPGPGPGPDPDIGIDVDEKVKDQIKKWGLYYFGSDSDQNWNLTYQPASGKSTPSNPPDPEPELHKARTKPQEVNYYVDDNDKYVVVQPNGTEITYSKKEFAEKYEEVG